MMRYDRFDSRLTIVCEFCRTRAMIVEDVIMPAACLCMLHAFLRFFNLRKCIKMVEISFLGRVANLSKRLGQ